MYASAAEALGKLLSGEEGVSCEITSMPPKIRHIANGIKYFSVQVTCSDGTQYGIPAYGAEAEELFLVAESAKGKVPCIAMVSG